MIIIKTEVKLETEAETMRGREMRRGGRQG